MGIQGWLLLALSLLVVAELVVLAALSPGQLLCQPAESFLSLRVGLVSGGLEAQLCVAS